MNNIIKTSLISCVLCTSVAFARPLNPTNILISLSEQYALKESLREKYIPKKKGFIILKAKELDICFDIINATDFYISNCLEFKDEEYNAAQSETMHYNLLHEKFKAQADCIKSSNISLFQQPETITLPLTMSSLAIKHTLENLTNDSNEDNSKIFTTIVKSVPITTVYYNSNIGDNATSIKARASDHPEQDISNNMKLLNAVSLGIAQATIASNFYFNMD